MQNTAEPHLSLEEMAQIDTNLKCFGLLEYK